MTTPLDEAVAEHPLCNEGLLTRAEIRALLQTEKARAVFDTINILNPVWTGFTAPDGWHEPKSKKPQYTIALCPNIRTSRPKLAEQAMYFRAPAHDIDLQWGTDGQTMDDLVLKVRDFLVEEMKHESTLIFKLKTGIEEKEPTISFKDLPQAFKDGLCLQ